MLVSEQAAANLLPALDPAIKPGKAILVVSAKMKKRAAALAGVLAEAGVLASMAPLDNEHDYATIESVLLDIAGNLSDENIALNVTGGTKLMALVAQSVAIEAKWSVIYVDVDTDEIHWLYPDTHKHKLAQLLRLPHYLRAYGYEIVPQPGTSTQDQEQLTKTLLGQIGSLELPLGQLNWLAQTAEDSKRLQCMLTPQQMDSRGLEALLRHFADAGLLQLEGDKLIFKSEEALRFVKGGWLEAHVLRTVGGLAKELGLRDMAGNLVVKSAEGVQNELDIAFLARNRLFVIECKTARMDGEVAPKTNDSLYKLAEIRRRVGGLGTRAMLASYRQLRDNERRLAKVLGIDLVCGAELTRLDEKIKGWVKG
jgi:hypothetical protein